MDLWTFKEVYLDRDYEKFSLPLQNGWTVIDIGAAFGDFSALAAKRFPQSRVYSFEPYPKYFDLISQNMALNKISNVTAFPSAVGSSSPVKILDISSGEAVMFTTSRPPGTVLPHQLKVPVTTLAGIFTHCKINSCDYLKMDCEAGEYEILFHAPVRILHKIHHICMEYHDNITAHTGTEMADFLKRAGFVVKIYPNRYRKDIGYLYAENTRFPSSG